jgi:hypothetical protein
LSLMRRPITFLAALSAAVVALVGCRRPPAATSSGPRLLPAEERCWWAPFRSMLPPDSVAVRFARAFAALGLTDGRWSHLGDTAWAEAGPSVLSDSIHIATGTYAARVVAFRRGDTTLFRTFVATPGVAPSVARDNIMFCGETMRAAKTGALAPRVEEADDASPVWRRRP